MAKELAVINTKSYALTQIDPQEAVAAIRELVGEVDIRTDLTTLPGITPGGKAWEVVHATGEVEELKEVTGVIVARRPTRSYYATAYEPGATEPPHCWSEPDRDFNWYGRSEDPKFHGRECDKCPFNLFGSATQGGGKGKACSEYVSLIMFREEDGLLPINVRVPPAALKHLKNYVSGLLRLGIFKLYDAVTKISLEPVKGAPPTWKFELVGRVDKASRDHLIARASLFAAVAAPFPAGTVTAAVSDDDEGDSPPF